MALVDDASAIEGLTILAVLGVIGYYVYQAFAGKPQPANTYIGALQQTVQNPIATIGSITGIGQVGSGNTAVDTPVPGTGSTVGELEALGYTDADIASMLGVQPGDVAAMMGRGSSTPSGSTGSSSTVVDFTDTLGIG